MATSSTKKPFSYCPGGINFSELKTKSPSMARRLEKHQEHMNTPSQATQQLLPSAPSPVNQQMVNHLFKFCLLFFTPILAALASTLPTVLSHKQPPKPARRKTNSRKHRKTYNGEATQYQRPPLLLLRLPNFPTNSSAFSKQPDDGQLQPLRSRPLHLDPTSNPSPVHAHHPGRPDQPSHLSATSTRCSPSSTANACHR